MPLFSIIVPVYNRQGELRRALQSIAAQTLPDFECVVVDDGSTRPIESIVAEFDQRFVYVKRDANGGCTAARLTGLRHAREGEFSTGLDSDNELYPWALERAAHYLRAYPDVDGATGLYMFPDGPRVRVADRVKVVGPEEYATRSASARADSVGVVRRSVAEEWLQLRPDYYNLDFVLWLRFRLTHRVVLVDEPWGRYDTTSTDKIAGRADPRVFEDMMKFVQDFRPLIGSTPCNPIDMVLTNMWVRLFRARRHQDAAAVADWLGERGISRPTALAHKIEWRARARLARLVPARAHVL